MNVFYLLLLFALVAALVALDLRRRINLMHFLPLTCYLLAAPNMLLASYWLHHTVLSRLAPFLRFGCLLLFGVVMLYLWIRLSIFPVLDGKKVGLRLKAMIGGRFLTLRSLWALALEIPVLLAVYPRLRQAGIPVAVLRANAICGLITLFLLLGNGILRMFLTSRRLNVVFRLVMVTSMWIPLVNLVVLGHACRLVGEEYDYALYKEDLRLTRVDSDLCKTKYPIIMVHGVLFKDLKYFNYWGRIPRELTRYGATIYYGNQEAAGTIAYNGEDIRKKIRQVLEETGCEKVNIIAHSKGGLDARYAISALGMADHVASMTSICVPHRGCRFIDLACGLLPDGFFRFLAGLFDSVYRKSGDKQPDFYTAIRQFSTKTSMEINQTMPDSPQVYYQSYMAKMKSPFSDSLLGLPFLLIRLLEGENDGLVSTTSAVWGDFRGVLTAKGRRGISHGDIIDLKREDYKGFDVREAYVNIVSDLKQRGY